MNDNSVVMMVSNCHGIEPLEMAKRWPRADKKPIDITHSFVIDQYIMGTWEELTEWIRTLAHTCITFQSGHRSGSLHSLHTFLLLPCKAHGSSIGRQLPFHFSRSE